MVNYPNNPTVGQRFTLPSGVVMVCASVNPNIWKALPYVDKALEDIIEQVDEALAEVDDALAGIQADAAAAIANTGWFVAGDFATGFTFTASNQVGRDSSGEFWSYNGSLPFAVAAGTVPSEPTYTQRGDAALRSALAAPDSTVPVGGVGAGDLGRKYGDFVTVADFNPTGGNDNAAMSAAIASKDVIYFTGSYNGLATVPDRTSLHVSSGNKSIIGQGQGGIAGTGVNYSGISVYDQNAETENLLISGLKVSIDDTSTDNNHPGLRLDNIKKSVVAFNNVTKSTVGLSTGYLPYRPENTAKVELRPVNNAVVANLATSALFGFQLFSPVQSSYIGNVSYKDGSRGVNHAFRYTGYGEEYPTAWGPTPATLPVDLRMYGNAIAGNVSANYQNGISTQAGVNCNTTVGHAITNCANGLQFNQQDNPDSISNRNIYSGIVIDDVFNGIAASKIEKTIFSDFSISNWTSRAIRARMTDAPTAADSGKYCRYSGLLSTSTKVFDTAADLYGSATRIDVTIADVNCATYAAVVGGDGNLVHVIASGLYNATSRVMSVPANDSVITVCATDVAGEVQSVDISGSRNVVDVNLSTSAGNLGKVNVSGTGNIIRGRCQFVGTISAGNDISGVIGAKRSGLITATTDASGDLTITHGLIYSASYSAFAQIQSANPYSLSPHSKTGTTFKVRVYDASGNPVVSTSVSIAWQANAETL